MLNPNRWFSVEKKMPPSETFVFFIIEEYTQVYLGFYDSCNGCWKEFLPEEDYAEETSAIVTHWKAIEYPVHPFKR